MKNRFAMLLIAGCVASTLTLAQSASPSAAKRELAVRVVALQQGAEMDRLLAQLAASAVQPMIATWGPKLEANVPQARQQAAADQLNAELKRYGDDATAIIKSKVAKVSDESLVDAYMDRFSEDELRQLNAFFSAPVIRKYQGVAPELGSLLIQKLIEAAKSDMQDRARAFDEVALRIVGPDRAPEKPPATQAVPATPAATEKAGRKAKK